MRTVIRPRRLGAAAVTLLVATTVLAAPVSATHGQPGKGLPFLGVMAGPVTSVVLAPGFPVVRSTFGERCSVPSDWVLSWAVTGEATHLGSFIGAGSHCSRLDLATGVAVYGDGVFMYTAANGDMLHGTYTNGYAPPDGTLTDEATITGGTGRFVGATGHACESGTADLTTTPPTFAATFGGWIAYDASERSGL